MDLRVEVDQKDVTALMRTMSRADKAARDELGKLRSKVAGMVRDEAVKLAPKRSTPRSIASKLYGPLSNKRKGGLVIKSLRHWGVRAPYYYHFVKDGVAGTRRAAPGPRPYYAVAMLATEKVRNLVIRDGIVRAMRDHFGDRIGG